MAKALITGASSGIGETFTRYLANLGYDLIIVARREERLRELADSLDVDVQIVVADLTLDADIEGVETIVRDCDDLEILVNNAGIGRVDYFADVDMKWHLSLIKLHIETTIRLCHAALPGMQSRRKGAIINVASFGGLVSMPLSANYNATKAYLVSFTESLSYEVRQYGITAQVLCPGFTRTEIFQRNDMDYAEKDVPDFLWMSTDFVVAQSLLGLKRGQRIVTPGIYYQLGWRIANLPLIRPLVKYYIYRLLKGTT